MVEPSGVDGSDKSESSWHSMFTPNSLNVFEFPLWLSTAWTPGVTKNWGIFFFTTTNLRNLLWITTYALTWNFPKGTENTTFLGKFSPFWYSDDKLYHNDTSRLDIWAYYMRITFVVQNVMSSFTSHETIIYTLGYVEWWVLDSTDFLDRILVNAYIRNI